MIEVEHKGMKIRWDVSADLWFCPALDYSSPSLATVKAEVDGFRRRERGAPTVRALRITPGSGFHECGVADYLGGRSGGVVIIQEKRDAETSTHRECRMAALALDTPENIAKLREAAALREQGRALKVRAQKIEEAIPRLTLEDIADLVEHADITAEVE